MPYDLNPNMTILSQQRRQPWQMGQGGFGQGMRDAMMQPSAGGYGPDGPRGGHGGGGWGGGMGGMFRGWDNPGQFMSGLAGSDAFQYLPQRAQNFVTNWNTANPMTQPGTMPTPGMGEGPMMNGAMRGK